jgi:hypothetical protein
MRLGFQSDTHGNIYREFAPTVYGNSLGMGDVNNLQLASMAATGATTTVAILGMLSIVSGPVGAAVTAIIGAGMAIAQFFKGCGQTCIVASQDANKIEPLLVQNLNAYLSSPVRYKSMQAAALNNFNTLWSTLAQACSDPALAAAGQRCISDRQRGACTWKASPGGWAKDTSGTWAYTPYGAAGSGDACWNWFIGYYDPIANDPDVQPDPLPGATDTTGTGTNITAGGTGTNTGTVSSGGISPLFLLGGLALAALLLMAD